MKKKMIPKYTEIILINNFKKYQVLENGKRIKNIFKFSKLLNLENNKIIKNMSLNIKEFNYRFNGKYYREIY